MTWILVTAQAPWAKRWSHTSTIDAAGAIYVIGGCDSKGVNYNDVWMSTDKGSNRALGYSRGTRGYSRGT